MTKKTATHEVAAIRTAILEMMLDQTRQGRLGLIDDDGGIIDGKDEISRRLKDWHVKWCHERRRSNRLLR